jgi:hypothetical protein
MQFSSRSLSSPGCDDFEMEIPGKQRDLLEVIVAGLREIPSVVGVVLGGSHARGVAHAGSDLDIGIYYKEEAPLEIARIREVAGRIATPGSEPMVTELYGWGPWVNGGAWIQTPVTKVDFIYRNVGQVERVIEEGRRGVWRHDYDQQPPFGFRSVVYFAETRYCVPLCDPSGVIARLKEMVDEYPEALRNTIVQESLWGAEFSLLQCRGYAAGGDVCNTVGCFARVAHFLTQALFALNGVYFLNEKQVKQIAAQFSIAPRQYVERMESVLCQVGRRSSELQGTLKVVTQIWEETVGLTHGEYRPRFQI